MSTAPTYCYLIPRPSFEDDTLEQLAQFTTQSDGFITVYWIRATKQVVINQEFPWRSEEKWYIQPDGYITDSIAEIVGVKQSVIEVQNFNVGHSYDMSTFHPQDEEMTNNFYNCKWSDYTCDHLIMQGCLVY